MEKLPQRPAIIDSPQRCTQLGTFTNKGRPINISHADRVGDSGRGSERVLEGGRGRENKEREPSYLMFCLVGIFSPNFLLFIHSPRTIISTKLGDLL